MTYLVHFINFPGFLVKNLNYIYEYANARKRESDLIGYTRVTF